MTDDDGKDTQVLATNQVPFDLEGTEEMDRGALLAAIQADRAGTANPERDSQEVLSDSRKTEQLPSIKTEKMAAVGGNTIPPAEGSATVHEATQHYVVPDSILEQVRDPQFRTLDVPMEALDPSSTQPLDTGKFEFDAQIDAFGRIPLPDIALTGRFPRGKIVRVLLTIIDE